MKRKKQVNRGRAWEHQHLQVYVSRDIVDAIKNDVIFPSEDANIEVSIEKKIKFLLDHYNEHMAWLDSRES